jgi:AcrR family transcriptional regulator
LPKPADQTFSELSQNSQAKLSAVTGSQPKRQSSEIRVQAIIAAAAEHFAEVGFEGSTREIARRVGVTQPLLYRYFPTKDSLIEAVYKTVYLDCWNATWDTDLKDRSLPVRQRFDRFYAEYTETIFNATWLRISYFAGLRDANINSWYNHVVEELVLKRLVREHRVELGMVDEIRVSPDEMKPAWLMHGGLVHWGWRKHILGLSLAEDTASVIADSLDMYFAVAGRTYAEAAAQRMTPRKAKLGLRK